MKQLDITKGSLVKPADWRDRATVPIYRADKVYSSKGELEVRLVKLLPQLRPGVAVETPAQRRHRVLADLFVIHRRR